MAWEGQKDPWSAKFGFGRSPGAHVEIVVPGVALFGACGTFMIRDLVGGPGTGNGPLRSPSDWGPASGGSGDRLWATGGSGDWGWALGRSLSLGT